MVFSDDVNISNDVSNQCDSKFSSISVKLYNFLYNNTYCPFNIKKKVFTACINSPLLYGCECWSYSNLKHVDVIHRKALKSLLSVRESTPNIISYLEGSEIPISILVQYRQLKFWLKIQNDINSDPTSCIAKIVDLSIENNVRYISYFQTLDFTYGSCENLYHTLVEKFKKSCSDELIQNSDNDSPIGTYKLINSSASFYTIPDISENSRSLLTRFRCGNHKLKIVCGA